MTPQRIAVRKISAVSAVIVLAVFAGVLFVLGADAGLVGESILKGGLAITVAGGFWLFYERVGWRLPIPILRTWLSPFPDLNGRWEGTVCRSEGDEPRRFVLEISQTFSTFEFWTYTADSQGHSEAVWLTANEGQNRFGAIGVWSTTTNRPPPAVNQRETFRGTSEWRVEFTDSDEPRGDKLRIRNDYYTARAPATRGVVEVERVSRQLRNSY